MNRYMRVALSLGFLLIAPVISARASDLSTWRDLNAAYHAWRPFYSPMVLPLSASTAQIEADVRNGTYGFTSEPQYYVDVSVGQWSYAAGCEVAASVQPGQWVYIIEDITSGQVLVFDANHQMIASFPAEPWPQISGDYENTLVSEIAKRRVVFWVQLTSEAQVQSEVDAAPANALSSENNYPALMDSGEGGEPVTCDPCMQDLDGDGYPNRNEIIAGTDPNDAASYPALTNFVWDGTSMTYYWHGVTNREYVLQTGPSGGYANVYAFTNVGSWLTGVGADLSQSDSIVPTNQDFAVSRLLIRERDSNTNGVPDWWELQQYGGLTTISATGDDDGDGLENQEEYFYGYSPTNSERFLYHSIFKVVSVNTNDPPGTDGDDGTERFDFHGGGRPLSLASNAADSFGAISGESIFSGGIYFNNDQSNLYIGISGFKADGGDNGLAVFLDTDSGGVTSLTNLSTATAPYGFSRACNIRFDSTQFTPNVGILLGSRYGDGKNYDNFYIGGNNIGQGVYDLSNNSDFLGLAILDPRRCLNGLAAFRATP